MTKHADALVRRKDILEDVRRMTKSWMLDREIAEKLGCSLRTVERIRLRNGLPSGQQRHVAHMKKQVQVMRGRGFTYSKIGKLLGVTRQRAHQLSREISS
jgi:DNA-directed RNA polymerase specialized sigma24 family protein